MEKVSVSSEIEIKLSDLVTRSRYRNATFDNEVPAMDPNWATSPLAARAPTSTPRNTD